MASMENKSKVKIRDASRKSPSDRRLSVKKSFSIREDENLFSAKFKKYCLKYESNIIPTVATVQMFQIKSMKVNPQEVVVCISNENENIMDLVFIKNWPIDDGIVKSLAYCSKYYNFKSLRLEFCNLESEHILVLQEMLKKDKTLTELSLNGNPTSEQNFHVLLRDTSILGMSLRFCKIDRVGAHLLSTVLGTTSCKLIHLNLSSNDINDDGAEHIATILRINRTLKSLNLMDNKITDTGCELIANAFKTFSLTHQEIVLKRSIKLKLLKVIETETSNFKKGFSNYKQANKSKDKIRRNSKDKSSIGSQASIGSKKSSVFSIEMTDNAHPFIVDSYEENNEIYCKGNNSMNHLNLSYNKITECGLKCIHGMLVYQKSTFDDQGLSYVNLEGNAYSRDCAEIKEINDSLLKKFLKPEDRISETSSNRKRRASGSRVSLLKL